MYGGLEGEGLDQIEVSHGAVHCNPHIMENQMAVLSNSKTGASGVGGLSEKIPKWSWSWRGSILASKQSTTPKKIFECKPQLINLSGDETNLLNDK